MSATRKVWLKNDPGFGPVTIEAEHFDAEVHTDKEPSKEEAEKDGGKPPKK